MVILVIKELLLYHYLLFLPIGAVDMCSST